MCNTPKKHQHYDAIVAWAEGKPIQYRSKPSDPWKPVFNPGWFASYEYRVKPEGIKYRLYLYQLFEQPAEVLTCAPDDYKKVESLLGFVRWLGDWKEVEV